jgi:hypothetical protein
VAPLDLLQTSCAPLNYFHYSSSISDHASSFIVFILDSVGRKRPLMFGAGSLVALFAILSAIVAAFPPGVGQSPFFPSFDSLCVKPTQTCEQ